MISTFPSPKPTSNSNNKINGYLLSLACNENKDSNTCITISQCNTSGEWLSKSSNVEGKVSPVERLNEEIVKLKETTDDDSF